MRLYFFGHLLFTLFYKLKTKLNNDLKNSRNFYLFKFYKIFILLEYKLINSSHQHRDRIRSRKWE